MKWYYATLLMAKIDSTNRNSSSDISSVSIAPVWNASSTCRTLHSSEYLDALSSHRNTNIMYVRWRSLANIQHTPNPLYGHYASKSESAKISKILSKQNFMARMLNAPADCNYCIFIRKKIPEFSTFGVTYRLHTKNIWINLNTILTTNGRNIATQTIKRTLLLQICNESIQRQISNEKITKQ